MLKPSDDSPFGDDAPQEFKDEFLRLDRRMEKYVVAWDTVINKHLRDLVYARWEFLCDECEAASEATTTVRGGCDEDGQALNETYRVPLDLPSAINRMLDELGIPDVPESNHIPH